MQQYDFIAQHKGYSATLERGIIYIRDKNGEKVADASHDWACNSWIKYVYARPDVDGILEGWDHATPEQVSAFLVYYVHNLLEGTQQ